MREYTFTEARQHFASILEEAKKQGIVCIRKKSGEAFYLRPASAAKSPLDVEGIDLGISPSEAVEIVRNGRERNYE